MVNKGVIILGSLAVGGLVFALTRKAKVEPPPEEGAAIIIIEVYDAQGNLVPRNSPLTVDEGASYTVKLTVTNNSTKGGVPWAASLGIGISAATEFTQLISSRVDIKNFAAGETKSFNYTMNIPVGLGGAPGIISAWIEDPSGRSIVSALLDFTIGTIAIVYGATITIS